MKYSLLFFLLTIAITARSQELDYDIQLDPNNSILLDGREISKHALKKHFKSFDGEEPNIQVNWSQAVSQSKLERIEHIISKEFDAYNLEFEFVRLGKKEEYVYYITGKVFNEDGQPLKNIIVKADDSRFPKATDKDGSFKIGISKETQSIVVVNQDYKEFEISQEEFSKFERGSEVRIVLTKKRLNINARKNLSNLLSIVDSTTGFFIFPL